MAAGRDVGSAVHAVDKAGGAITGAIAKVPFVGPVLNDVIEISGTPLELGMRIAKGERIDRAVFNQLKQEVKAAQSLGPWVASVVSFVPGVGPVVSGAIGAAVALSEGKPIDQAAIAALKSAIPGGALAQAVFDVGTNLAVAVASHKNLIEAGIKGAIDSLPLPDQAKKAMAVGLDVMHKLASGQKISVSDVASMATSAIGVLPPDAQAAIKNSISAIKDPIDQATHLANSIMKQVPMSDKVRGALMSGFAVQHAQTLQQAKKEGAPGAIDTLASIGNGMGKTDGVIGCGRKLAQNSGAHGFDVGTGLMSRQIGIEDLQAIRNDLTGDDRKGFDLAVSLHIGRVTYPSSQADPCMQAGYYITMGIRGQTPDNKQAMVQAVSSQDEAKSGAVVAIKQVAIYHERWYHKVLKWMGLST